MKKYQIINHATAIKNGMTTIAIRIFFKQPFAERSIYVVSFPQCGQTSCTDSKEASCQIVPLQNVKIFKIF